MKWFVQLQYTETGAHVYTSLEADTPGEALDKAIIGEHREWSGEEHNFPVYPTWTVRPSSYFQSETEASKVAEEERKGFLAGCWDLRVTVK